MVVPCPQSLARSSSEVAPDEPLPRDDGLQVVPHHVRVLPALVPAVHALDVGCSGVEGDAATLHVHAGVVASSDALAVHRQAGSQATVQPRKLPFTGNERHTVRER